jgi:hypothetical protein
LRRRIDCRAKLGRRMPRPTRIVQHPACQRDEIRLAARDDVFGLLCFGDQAEGDRRESSGFLHGLRKRNRPTTRRSSRPCASSTRGRTRWFARRPSRLQPNPSPRPSRQSVYPPGRRRARRRRPQAESASDFRASRRIRRRVQARLARSASGSSSPACSRGRGSNAPAGRVRAEMIKLSTLECVRPAARRK